MELRISGQNNIIGLSEEKINELKDCIKPIDINSGLRFELDTHSGKLIVWYMNQIHYTMIFKELQRINVKSYVSRLIDEVINDYEIKLSFLRKSRSLIDVKQSKLD